MFSPSTAPSVALAERVRELGEVLAGFAGQGDSAADLVVLLGELETLKCRAEGAQAMAAIALDASVRAEQAAAGVPADRRGQGRRSAGGAGPAESHSRGARHLGLARTLAAELPHTLAALRAGRISEWRATLICRETACLTRDDRAHIDQVARRPDPGRRR
jgi:hypothetical protein